jgi:hypothetical protein
VTRATRHLRLSIAAILAAALTSEAALAQQKQAGVAAAVRGRVEIAAAAGSVGREVKSGEPIYLGNVIKSGPESGLQIMLLDQTTFTIGPDSELVIDQFVFDPAAGTGKVAASVAKGVFRFVTGKVAQKDPASMSVRLPAGNIGIRGTIAIGAVEPAPMPGAPPQRQEVVLLGPGRATQGSDRPGGLLLGAPSGASVMIDQPGFGSTFQRDGSWGTPVRYTIDMLNAIQSRLGPAVSSKGPGPGGPVGPGGRPGGPGGPGAPGGPGMMGPPGLYMPPGQIIPGATQAPCQASSVASCPRLNPPSSLTTAIPDGASTYDQLRTVASGQFYYTQSNVPLSGGGTYNIFANIDFGARSYGGGNSRVEVNGLNVNGTLAILSKSYASLSGTASFVDPNVVGLSGVLCSPSCTTTITVSPQNSGGTAGATANHSVVINGMGPTTQGSGTAGRVAGLAP